MIMDPAVTAAASNHPAVPATASNLESDSLVSRLMGYVWRNNKNTTEQAASLEEETRQLASFAVTFSLERFGRPGRSDTEVCLRHCILRMHEKHSMVFSGMMTRLNINRNIDFYEGFIEVSEELFKDEVNWSKIVALYAFGARLGQFCVENNMEDLILDITASLARFSLERLLPFIQTQGGWNSLCTAFPLESDVESEVWKSLVILGLSLGAASLYLHFRK